MNPYTSIWNKPKPVFIHDRTLWVRWNAIVRHLTIKPTIVERYGYIEINNICYIAKKSSKFRLKSHLDWAYYTPKTLADAINNNQIESYYEIMLNDVRSDPNDWKDKDIEMELKSFYANRAHRCNLIP